MDPERKRTLRLILDNKLAELHQRVKGAKKDLSLNSQLSRPPVSREDDGSFDSAQLVVDEFVLIKLIEFQSVQAEQVQKAIHRLEAGRYGYCSVCASEISEIRLRALPFAIRCIDCQNAEELVNELERRSRVSSSETDSFVVSFSKVD